MHPDAAALIERLQLMPHPEGGFYREIFRSPALVQPADGRPARLALTTIYFLLPEGAHSRWHRVASDEVWNVYEGAPLELYQAGAEMAAVEEIVLGPAASTAGPMHTVPAGSWQAARSRGPYTLAGCTVGPGFVWEDFSFLRDAPDLLERLRALDPALAALA